MNPDSFKDEASTKKKYHSRGPEDARQLDLFDESDLEHRIRKNFTILKQETLKTKRTYNYLAKNYNTPSKERKDVLEKGFRRFSETGEQPISNYTDRQVDSLYHNLFHFYRSKLKDKKNQINEFHTKYEDIIKR